MRGVQIFGGIGSGKSTGSGRTLVLKYLNAGFGGIVLCGKVDERIELYMLDYNSAHRCHMQHLQELKIGRSIPHM